MILRISVEMSLILLWLVYWQGFSMDVHKIVQVDLKFPTKAIVSAVAKDFIDACKDSTLEKVLGHTWIVQNADPSGVQLFVLPENLIGVLLFYSKRIAEKAWLSF
ncbi:PREDICTED: uncharacterized protein LOC109222441 [Nicotiana attenuata]|uniref:uncharacterized protein LOC109222441 n=1 Tax=Nicotiana attenuata TaxID=49451 RepID=UPI0009049016|nr:PREDICTED: uncharacterized protein LOC109222441 [Nicotiana attenuata]